MNYDAKTSLNLSLSPRKNDPINLNLVFDPSSSIRTSVSPPLSPVEQRVFSCHYCRRKFYSSQALGGHQNAHKLERTLARRSRELSSAVRPHSGSNQRPGSSYGRMSLVRDPSIGGFDHQSHEGRFGRRDVNYGQSWINNEYENVHQQEDLGQLDLSLRL